MRCASSQIASLDAPYTYRRILPACECRGARISTACLPIEDGLPDTYLSWRSLSADSQSEASIADQWYTWLVAFTPRVKVTQRNLVPTDINRVPT